MPEVNLQKLLLCAVETAHAAGGHALRHIERRFEIAERHEHDVKLQLDIECQREAERVIKEHFPGHAILGEEGGSNPEGAEICWIVDPIDGTVNFLHGMPVWCSSVAVRQENDIVAGAVFAPAANELYTATLIEPAQLNGDTIYPSSTPELKDSLILTGLSKKIEESTSTFPQFEALAVAAQKVRIMGSAALDICHVACGRADGYVEPSIYIWDVAAAGLIARQAGAETEVLQRFDDVHMQYLCSNRQIHEQLKKVVMDKA